MMYVYITGCGKEMQECSQDQMSSFLLEDARMQSGKEKPCFTCPQCTEAQTNKENVLACLGRDIQKEMSVLCGKKLFSVFRVQTSGKKV